MKENRAQIFGKLEHNPNVFSIKVNNLNVSLGTLV